MGKIVSYDEFKKQGSHLSEDDYSEMPEMEHSDSEGSHGRDHQYYMFFKNISAIKHYITEIEAMDPDELDKLLRDGHDWAADHIATSKDDIQEVADWVRGEMEDMNLPAEDMMSDREMPALDGEDDSVELQINVEDNEDEEDEEEGDESE